MKTILNKHKNKLTQHYRYKKIELNTQDVVELHFPPTNLGYSVNQTTNGIRYVLVRYDYKPYFLYTILWSIIIWYKRPRLKAIINHPIISKLGKYSLRIIIGLIIGIILLLIERGVIDIGI